LPINTALGVSLIDLDASRKTSWNFDERSPTISIEVAKQIEKTDLNSCVGNDLKAEASTEAPLTITCI
jgi:hypothetical protein